MIVVLGSQIWGPSQGGVEPSGLAPWGDDADGVPA